MTSEIDDQSRSNPKAASTRIKSATSRKFSGQIRHDLRRGPQPQYVDAARSHLNRTLIKPPTPVQMKKICEERRALRQTERAIKSNAAVATIGIITFGSEAAHLFEKLSTKDQDAVFLEISQAIADRLATSLHALVVHLDEATVHAHYTLAAYNRFGDPISKSTSPKVLSDLQTITAEIMGRYCPGIERGRRYGDCLDAGADFADTIHKSVAELHRTLPADLEKKRADLVLLVQAESDAKARVDEMQDRVQKLAEKTDLSVKEIKRLETYERRLNDRIVDLSAIQAQSEAAKSEADRIFVLTQKDREAEKSASIKMAEKTEAVRLALLSLAHEVSEGTLHTRSDGKLSVQAPDKIIAALPEIGPALRAASGLVSGIKTTQSRLEEQKSQLDRELAEIKETRRYLDAGLVIVEKGMRFILDKMGLQPPESILSGMLAIKRFLTSVPKDPSEEIAPPNP